MAKTVRHQARKRGFFIDIFFSKKALFYMKDLQKR